MEKASVQLQKHRGEALGWKDPPQHHHHGDVLIVSVCRHAGCVEGWRVRKPEKPGPGASCPRPPAAPSMCTCWRCSCAPGDSSQARKRTAGAQSASPGCYLGLACSWTIQEGCFMVLETCPDAQTAKPSVAAGSRGGENTSQDSLWGLLFL